MPSFEESREHFLKTEVHERKRREIAELVTASDTIRQLIANNELEKQVAHPESSQAIFWQIHKIHAGKNFYRAINVDHAGDHVNENVESLTTHFAGADIENQVGSLRQTESSVDDFMNVRAEHLPKLAADFFATIDDFMAQPDLITLPIEAKHQFLARVEVIQTLCHFPADLSGRTIEDFMVYLAKKMGLELTFSTSGFRGFIEGDVVDDADDFRSQIRASTIQELTSSAIERYSGLNQDIIGEFVRHLYDGALLNVQSTQAYVEELSNYVMDKGNVSAIDRLEVLTLNYTLISEELTAFTETLIAQLTDESEVSMWGIFENQLDAFAELLERAEQTTYHEQPYYGFAYVMKSISMAKGFLRSAALEPALVEIIKAERLLLRITAKLDQPRFTNADKQRNDWFVQNFSKTVRKLKQLILRLQKRS